jgi:hypothetical protein
MSTVFSRNGAYKRSRDVDFRESQQQGVHARKEEGKRKKEEALRSRQ